MLLIKNGLIFNGKGQTPFKKDIVIKEDKIIALEENITNFSNFEKIINAQNAFVFPGFIDINTDSDHFFTIFSEPYQKDFLKQGVTTIIGGNCGTSLAPFFYHSLSAFHEWPFDQKINIDWHNFKEFKDLILKKGIGVNFGTLIGHNTIRRFLTKGELRDLTEGEIEVFKMIIEENLKIGAFGFSSGLNFFHSRQIPYYELKELTKIVSNYKKVFAVHLRNNEEDIVYSILEIIELAKENNLNIEISHLQPLKNFKTEYLKAKEIINKAADNVLINFDCNPFNSQILPIYMFLPVWFQDNNNFGKMLEIVLADHLKPRLLEYFRKFNGDLIIINHVPENLKFLQGKTLTEYANLNNISTSESLLKLMRITHLKASLIYRNIDEDLLKEFLKDEQVIIASNGFSSNNEFKHERDYQTFTKFLKLVLNEKIMPLEKAIYKITYLPAKKYNIFHRGLIEEGCFADLVIYKDEKINYVLVNGEIVIEEGEFKEKLKGKFLTN